MYKMDEQDATVLKHVLPLMSQYAAGYHPISYTVWYEYARGGVVELRRDIDAHIARAERLTVPATHALYVRHLLEPAQETLMAARNGLVELASQVKNAVDTAGSQASGFDGHLGQFQRELESAVSVEDLARHVAAMITETQRVGGGLAEMSRQLRENKDEVQRLLGELRSVRQEALTDALTGLLNRHGFDRELERLMQSMAAPDDSLSLIIFDIDNFKRINDTYGHPLGDRVIAAVGQSIRECAGAAGIAARYGGEEFTVLLAAGAGRARDIAQSVCSRVEQGRIRRRDGEEAIGGVTISAGVACWNPADDRSALLQRADRALYASKSAGRNRVTVDAADEAHADTRLDRRQSRKGAAVGA